MNRAACSTPFRALVLAAAVLASGSLLRADDAPKSPAAPEPAEPAPPAAKLRFVEVSPSCRVAVRSDGKSTAGFIVGKTGVLVIDCLDSAALGGDLLREVRRVTDKPIRHVVLTHWHYDHVVGDQAFPEGTDILATEAAAKRLRERLESDKLLLGPASGMHGTVGIAKVRNATTTIAGEREIDLGELVVKLSPAGESHTGGDLVVYVPAEKVLFAGDLVWNGVHPNLSEGSTFKWIAALAALERLDAAKVVPGHGEPGDKALLATQRLYLMTLRRVVKHLAKNKVPLDEVVKELQVPEAYKEYLFPEWWSQGVRYVYEELVNGR